MSDIYFDGDPATDSARRHLERVLKEEPPRRRRWPWILTAIAGAGVWYFWPRSARETRKTQGASEREQH
jgi:hypothetical protein